MKFSQFLIENDDWVQLEKELTHKYQRGTISDLIKFVNDMDPPNIKAQEFVWDWAGPGWWADLKNVHPTLLNPTLLNKMVTDTNFITDNGRRRFEIFLKNNFKSSLLVNKWLRYYDAIAKSGE